MRGLFLASSLLATVTSAPAIPAMPIVPSRPVVAVIDSGIARTAELAPALLAEYDMATPRNRPSFAPRYYLGTMVATILLREARRPIDILSLRIDDPNGCPAGVNPPCQPDAEPLAKAIRTATALRVNAINISLALKDDPSIVDAIRDAAAQGIPIILAAGNDGLDHPGNLAMARAGFPKAILVGALDADGEPWKGTNRPDPRSAGYNYAWQRGVAVPTVLANGRSTRATGTSFAAPIETARLLQTWAATKVRTNDLSLEQRPGSAAAPASPAL